MSAASLDAWAAAALTDARFLQVGSMLDPDNASAGVAARLGAREVALLDPTPAAHPGWAAAREAVALAGLALECLSGRHPLDRGPERDGRLRRWGVVWCARQIFHVEDPLALVRRCAELSEGLVVLRTTRLPPIPGALREGEAVCAMEPRDPRLPAIREALEARGVRLPQFDPRGPARALRWGGRYAPAMWTWFFTAGALEDLLWSCGLEPVERFDEWGDLAVSFVARQRAGAAPPLIHADVGLPDDARVGLGVAADPGAEGVAPLGEDGVAELLEPAPDLGAGEGAEPSALVGGADRGGADRGGADGGGADEGGDVGAGEDAEPAVGEQEREA